MTHKTTTHIKLQDPLSEVTRKERRALLGFGILGIGVAEAGIIPSKIPALGVEFASSDQANILFIFALMVIYYLAAFIVYASSDFLSWRLSYIDMAKEIVESRRETDKLSSGKRLEEEKVIQNFMEKHNIALSLSGPASIIRAIFEFILPIIVGFYSIYVLLNININSPGA